jgi:splicing factor U2AF subunit
LVRCSRQALCADLRAECGKYGTVTDLVVPRQGSSGASFDYSGGAVAAEKKGVGKCFVKYKSHAEAASALKELGQRLFEGRELDLDLFDEQRFNARDFYGQ